MKYNFEDLLDELEENHESPSINTKKPAPKSEIDDFLEELKDIEKIEPIKTPVYTNRAEETKKAFQKCYPLIASGSSQAGYCVSSARPVPCDKLRCTRCDLPVKRFLNKVWKPESEYLFFRNNFSRDDKLATMMANSSGSAAYSCQCAWKSINEPINLNGDIWVCAGHYV
jgi:Retinal Maintenance